MKITKEQGELFTLDNYKEQVLMFHVELEGNISPDQLPELLLKFDQKVSKKDWGLTFGISGRMPVWAFAAIAHQMHPARAIGCYDPRLQAIVVIQSHDTSDHPIKVGEMLYFS